MEERERLTVLAGVPPQLQTAGLLCVNLMGQRFVKPLVKRIRVTVTLEQECVGRIEVPSQGEAVGVLAREDDFPVDGLSVSVRPADESAGASVGVPATRPIR